MTTRAEQLRTGEVLSPVELGKKTHAIIINVATKLQEVPEFRNALYDAFFNTNLAFEGRNIDRIRFQKGGYIYGIAYKAERSHSVSKGDPSSHVSISLSIIKNPVAFPRNLLYVDLTTEFDETHGEISQFTDGTARVQDASLDVREGAGALEKMPKILGDLFTPIKP
ncbi:MAG: hypothetical protein HYW62_01800 [Candidatus Levybacteria bacterium]|nr:hypothetical protein [Candidatus Levybacteria bacterium]